jgi:hypothetical protein
MKRSFLFLALVALLVLSLSACEKEKGPAEKAGEAIDGVIENAGSKLEEVGEALKEEADK